MVTAPDSTLLSPLRIATYNIHKGVQGVGFARRLEIHNLLHAVEGFDADIVCLQEVRKLNRREAARFAHWPEQPQADYLAPDGYQAVYQTNAFTRHGEHGNALLTRWPIVKHQHHDVSDHRFEQRGLLHVEVMIRGAAVHVIVAHFGLIPASRARQAVQLVQFIAREVPSDAPLVVAGDFNEWGTRLDHIFCMAGLRDVAGAPATYPSTMPVVQLDCIYTRGMEPLSVTVPRGSAWRRMSDHLPLIADFEWTA